MRTKSGAVYNNTPCKYGYNCNNWITKGSCTYKHTKSEIIALKKKYHTSNITMKKKFKPRSQRGAHGGQRKHSAKPRGGSSGSSGRTPRCRFGDQCNQARKGACRYFHPRSERFCTQCKQKGHWTYNCPKTRTTYTPHINPNPNRPQSHNALALQVIDGITYQPQWKPINAPSDTTTNTNDPPPSNSKSKRAKLRDLHKQIQKVRNEPNKVTFTEI